MAETSAWEAVRDAAQAQAIATRTKDILSGTAEGSFELRRMAGWSAAPIESPSRLGETEVRRFSLALSSNPEAFAVALEPLEHVPPVFRMSTTEEGFTSFTRACSHFNYCVVPSDFSAVILCSTADFIVAAGPASMVGRALGRDVATAFEEFEVFARAFRSPMQAVLLSVLVALRDEWPAAGVDSRVRFPK